MGGGSGDLVIGYYCNRQIDFYWYLPDLPEMGLSLESHTPHYFMFQSCMKALAGSCIRELIFKYPLCWQAGGAGVPSIAEEWRLPRHYALPPLGI